MEPEGLLPHKSQPPVPINGICRTPTKLKSLYYKADRGGRAVGGRSRAVITGSKPRSGMDVGI
jgi:hypothetical protein